MDGVKILQIILILLALGVVLYILRLYHAIKLEKRIAPFATISVNDKEISLFDFMYFYLEKLVTKLSQVLKKSVFLKNYSRKYNKYTSRNNKDEMNFVSIKLLTGLLLIFLSLLSLLFKQISLNLMLIIIIFIIAFYIPDLFLHIEYLKKRKDIENDLLKAIIIMNSAFSSGKNIMQAINIVKTELDGPIADEFEKIYLDITYGLSIDIVFERFYQRVKLADAKYIAASLAILNKTGGDINKVFDMIEKSIIERKNLKNELNSLTASSRFVFKLLISLPLVLTLIITLLNPSYFKPLITNLFGIIVIAIIVSLYILYILVIRKVMKVEI